MKGNLRKNLKNSWLRTISLFVIVFIARNSYSALKPAVENIDPYNKEVSYILKTKNGTELFNALTQRDGYLAAIIKLSKDQKISDDKRWMLIMSMTKLGGASVIPDLVGLKAANSWYIRSAVAKSLGMLRTNESLKKLDEMLDDPSLVVRTVVVDSIGDSGNISSMSSLVKELDDSNNFHKGQSLWIRKHIIDSIAKTGGKRSIPVLISHLEDVDPEVARHSKSNLMALVSYSNSRWDKKRWEKWWKNNSILEQ